MSTQHMAQVGVQWAARGLWVSAGVLLGLMLFRSEPIAGAPPLFQRDDRAHGGSLGNAGGYTITTSAAGNEDLFLVLDGRKETLMVYRAENNNAVQLYQTLSLPQVFQEGRAGSGVGRR